jgi:ribonuclease T
MNKKYISVYVESCGSSPGQFSMLSLGACIVGERHTTFYRELKPINNNYNIASMRVVIKGLNIIKDKSAHSEYDSESELFNPKIVWNLLKEKGEEPQRVMKDFHIWIRDSTEGYEPVEVAAPIKFHGMFTDWYFDNFHEGDNPVMHGGDDINSMFRGLTKNNRAHIIQLGLRPEQLTYNALDHALVQAKEFEIILDMMREESA